ncbi:unnamed protein product, partial [Mesorhabditis spiculigera]
MQGLSTMLSPLKDQQTRNEEVAIQAERQRKVLERQRLLAKLKETYVKTHLRNMKSVDGLMHIREGTLGKLMKNKHEDLDKLAKAYIAKLEQVIKNEERLQNFVWTAPDWAKLPEQGKWSLQLSDDRVLLGNFELGVPSNGTYFTFGRGGACDFVIPDPTVSFLHGVLYFGRDSENDKDVWHYTDLGSSFGSKVNGNLVLEYEDVNLSIGGLVEFGGAHGPKKGYRLQGPIDSKGQDGVIPQHLSKGKAGKTKKSSKPCLTDLPMKQSRISCPTIGDQNSVGAEVAEITETVKDIKNDAAEAP